ncbi:MAG: hypothetical protein GX800_11275 [Clostridiaceae bacterium]|nr:hypothetical protein [Clostridiaceae bacterium]
MKYTNRIIAVIIGITLLSTTLPIGVFASVEEASIQINESTIADAPKDVAESSEIITIDGNEIEIYNSVTYIENPNFSVKSVILKNAAGVITNSIAANGTLYQVIVTKKVSDVIPAKMIAAVYDDIGKLVKMSVSHISGTGTINSDTTYTLNMQFNPIITEHKLKIMIWDDMDTLEPFATPYDSDIIMIDTVYNNTIETSGQQHSYEFTVPQDGNYAISAPTGTGISGSLYHSSNPTTPLATKSNMSSTNKLFAYMSRNEVYTIKLTSTTTGIYSFMLTASTDDSAITTLSLTTAATANIAYVGGYAYYKFTPTDTATYFIEASGNILPFGTLIDSSNETLAYEDNLEYANEISISHNLTSGQTYYIKIGSKARQIGTASIYIKKVKVTTSGTNSVSFTGKLGTASSKRVGISIYDQAGTLVNIWQVNTVSGGTFSYSLTLPLSGKGYQYIINQAANTIPVYGTFGSEMITNKIKTTVAANAPPAATVSRTFSRSNLAANTTFGADFTIKNNDSANSQEIFVDFILYNSSGEIVRSCGMGYIYAPNQQQVQHTEMQLPSNVSGHTLKIFIWQGASVYNSSHIPLYTSYSVTTSGTSTLSLPSEELDEESIGETEVTSSNELIDTEIDESIIETYEEKRDTYQAQTEGLNIVPAGFGQLDQIDMNYQVTYDGKNTGGVLKYGTNNVKVFFKNKTTSSVTFEPLVLWGEYDENGDLQTTYFQWCDPVTVAAKGQNGDVLTIDYKVKAPNGTDFACGYWAINSDYDYVCLNPIAMRVDGLYQGQATPLFFQEAGGGKYIFCNNREGIKRTDLADSNNPNGARLLMHEKGLGNGEYEMMISHNNDTSLDTNQQTGQHSSNGTGGFPIFVDAQFYDPYGTARIEIESAAYYIPTGKVDPYLGGPLSYACIPAYANYRKIQIVDLALNNPYNPQTVMKTKNSTTKYIHNFSESNSLWAGDVFVNNVYTSVPNGYVMYMVLKFRIVNSNGVEVNVAAFRDNGNGLNNRFSNYQAGGDPYVTAPFQKDYQYKGIADTLPLVESHVILAFDDTTQNNSSLPVTVFNAFEPGGRQVNWWKTQLNPQADSYNADFCAESDMIKIRYNDPTKRDAYGISYSGAKDGTWQFDVFHSDTYQFPANRNSSNNPNYILPRPTIQGSSRGSSNVNEAANLANYGVVTRYYYRIRNYGVVDKSIKINLETRSNNVIIARYITSNPQDQNDPSNIIFAKYKGEINPPLPAANDTVFWVDAFAGYETYFCIDIILPTGNAGGMKNEVVVTN